MQRKSKFDKEDNPTDSAAGYQLSNEARGGDWAPHEAAEGKLETKVPRPRVEEPYEIEPSPHSLLSILFPAAPPPPRNARIVRIFDIEAAEKDNDPGESLGAQLGKEPLVEERKDEPRGRKVRRAARNQSLLVAARRRLE